MGQFPTFFSIFAVFRLTYFFFLKKYVRWRGSIKTFFFVLAEPFIYISFVFEFILLYFAVVAYYACVARAFLTLFGSGATSVRVFVYIKGSGVVVLNLIFCILKIEK